MLYNNFSSHSCCVLFLPILVWLIMRCSSSLVRSIHPSTLIMNRKGRKAFKAPFFTLFIIVQERPLSFTSVCISFYNRRTFVCDGKIYLNQCTYWPGLIYSFFIPYLKIFLVRVPYVVSMYPCNQKLVAKNIMISKKVASVHSLILSRVLELFECLLN